MKKTIVLLAGVCLLLSGCADTQLRAGGNFVTASAAGTNLAAAAEEKTETKTIAPLPDTTMENLTDAVLSVSLKEGDAYVDDTGKMQMDLTVYAYDRYDMADIAGLQVGDTLVRHSVEVKVLSKEQKESGTVSINGGAENGGFDLAAEDGVFYETDLHNSKNWYAAGEATIRVSVDFKGTDSVDPSLGEVLLYPGDFLIGAVKNYDFTPHNTTIRVENGQIIEMKRVPTP